MPNPSTHKAPTGDTIKQARQSAGLTRLELAAALTGATPEQLDIARQIFNLTKTIEQWEAGRQTPSPAYTRALRAALPLDQDP